mmetsp:Transcript_25429/g.82778  ORF Transcript_25429/g.82778 Transcript_25429/m.82778 type:complete len:259 (+) Transcript_25429:30-806(+)
MLLIPIGLAGVVLFSSAATRPPRASPKCAAEAMPTVWHPWAMPTVLYAPGTRASYAGNLAGFLVDLHDAKATFNFCGGMMFQLALSDKLHSHLSAVSSRGASDAQQPVLHDAGKRRMQQLAGYDKTGAADNARVFHGREAGPLSRGRHGHGASAVARRRGGGRGGLDEEGALWLRRLGARLVAKVEPGSRGGRLSRKVGCPGGDAPAPLLPARRRAGQPLALRGGRLRGLSGGGSPGPAQGLRSLLSVRGEGVLVCGL